MTAHAFPPATRLPILVLGAETCEDTAIARDRLAALRVPSDYIDIDADPDAHARVERLNDGRRITPTIVVGDEQVVVAEPSVERVDRLADEAGYSSVVPAATVVHGELTERAMPLRELPTSDGRSYSIATLRGSRQVALFLAHHGDCLTCLGYARQLAAQASALEEADATVVVVVPGVVDAMEAWRHALPTGTCILADTAAGWREQIGRTIGTTSTDATVLVLDRFLAPRAVSSAADAGGLIAPSEVTSWHRFVALDCPECSGELPWPLDTGG